MMEVREMEAFVYGLSFTVSVLIFVAGVLVLPIVLATSTSDHTIKSGSPFVIEKKVYRCAEVSK
jgi:hypothetical protein